MEFLEPQARQLYKILGHAEGDGYSDVRCILADGPLLDAAIEKFKNGHGGRAPDEEETKRIKVVNRSIIKGEEAVIAWARKYNGHGNCYIGRSARTEKGALKEFRTITADIDPNRERGTSADGSLQSKALAAGKALTNVFRGGYCAASGNGVLVIYRLAEPVLPDFKVFEAKYKQFEEEMRKVLPEGVTLDATFDTARMVKLLGTVSTKGDKANWRNARFIDFPMLPFARNDIRARIETCGGLAAPVQGTAFKNTVYQSRSESDFALAVHYKKAGLSKEDTLSALSNHALGRKDRHDDHLRIITKVFDEGQSSDQSKGNNTEENRPLQVSQPGDHLDGHRERLYNRKNNPNPEIFIGVRLIDRLTWGLRRGEITTVAARPSIGKTSVAVSVAARMAREGKRVLFFTSEMSTDTTYDRLLQVLSGVPGDKFNAGDFTDEDKLRIDAAYGELKRLGVGLTICDKTSPTVQQVRRTAEEVTPDLVIYDHVQHIGGENESARSNVSSFIRGLKDVARDLNCAVLALSQIKRLYRDAKTGKELRPTLSDLKESGTIEEESGAVLLLSILSDEPNNPVRYLYAELAKNRFGPLGIVGIEFNKLTCEFKDMENAEGALG